MVRKQGLFINICSSQQDREQLLTVDCGNCRMREDLHPVFFYLGFLVKLKNLN